MALPTPATSVLDLPVISAAHVLGIAIYLAAQSAYHSTISGDPRVRWTRLTADQKAHYIETAQMVLETYRPAPSEDRWFELAVSLARTDARRMTGTVIGAIEPKEKRL